MDVSRLTQSLHALRRRAYTLIEMLTTVAVLIIVLGLMVSLARYVRDRAAVSLTKDVLRQLDQLMAQYAADHEGHFPAITSFPPIGLLRSDIDPVRLEKSQVKAARIRRAALDPPDMNRTGMRHANADRRDETTDAAPPSQPTSPRTMAQTALANNQAFVQVLRADTGLTGGALADMPLSMYDEVTLRDAWGSPIVFMRGKHPRVGTAPQDRFFFFSAGPDRLYMTQDDNLYSYEEGGG